MYTKTVEQTIYTFEDVKKDLHGIKDKVLDKLHDINVGYEWWDGDYEDAKRVEVYIEGFDLGRGKSIQGTASGLDTAELIIKNHGEHCDTYIRAKELQSEIEDIGYDQDNEDEEDDYICELEELESCFNADILQCYLTLLESQYEYLLGEEAILETLSCNEYEFDESGEIV